jgi:hypothetical protein
MALPSVSSLCENLRSWLTRGTVLVAATSLWWRVDYWCKALAPWAHLSNGPQTAERTVLLDYISPVLPVSLYKAIIRHDWAAASSSIVYVALKVGIIVSTGLLVLEPTNIAETDVPFTVSKDFNSSGFDASTVTSEPFLVYYGIQVNNLSYPNGTSDTIVVPPFTPLDVPENTTSFSAVVEGLSTHLDCEVVHPTRGETADDPWIIMLATSFLVDIDTPSCKIKGVIAGEGPKNLEDLVEPVLEQYQGWIGNYTCNTGIEADTYEPGTAPINATFTDHRLVITTSLVKWNTTDYLLRHTWLDQFTTLLCKPSYSIDQYQVDFSQSSGSVGKPVQAKRVNGSDSSHLTGLSNLDTFLAVNAAISEATLGFGTIYHQPEAEEFGLAASDMMEPNQFFLLLQAMKGDEDFKALMDPNTLMTYATKAFTGVFTQIAHNYLLQSSDQSILGSIDYTESRLQAKALSFGLLLGCLVIALSVSLLLVKAKPRDLVSRDPQGIGASATILASSFEFQHYMRDLGSFSTNALSDVLSRYSFQSRATKTRFQITPIKARKAIGEPARRTSDPPSPRSCTWWSPMALKVWYACIAILLPLFTVAALQVVQQQSDSDDGFTNINQGSSRRVLITYIPAIVLTGVATLYSGIQFSTALFAPLLKMRHQAVSATRSLSSTAIGQSYFEALYHSLRDRHLSSAISIIAAFVGLFLSTVSSGLYYIENVPSSQLIGVSRSDVFNLSMPNSNLSQGDNIAGAVTNLIFNQNLSFPQWTHENLVFPQLKLGPDVGNTDLSAESFTLHIQLPALRPSLICSVEKPSTIETSSSAEPFSGTNTGALNVPYALEFGAAIPSACSQYNRSAVYPSYQGIGVAAPLNNTKIYAANMVDLSWSVNTSSLNDGSATAVGSCKNIAFFFTRISAKPVAGVPFNSTSDTWEVDVSSEDKLITCYQRVEEVNVNVTFTLPGFQIDLTRPPTALEDTAHYIHSPANNIDWAFQTEEHMRYELTTSEAQADPDELHPAIYTMVYGRWGVPPTELLSGDSAFTDAANRLWGYYMAQAISLNFRQTSDAATFSGTLVQSNRGRLKQDAAVKWTLQAMLLTMTLCGIGVYLTMHAKEVLPHDPCSIAGMMSLFAGSELTGSQRLIPRGSEWNGVRDDERMWDGWVISLGWWKTVHGAERYGIDVGVAERHGEEVQRTWRERLAERWRRRRMKV